MSLLSNKIVCVQEAYDFIHARNLLASIKSIPKLFSNIYTRLKPGAYAQFGEMDGYIVSDDNSIPENWPPMRCSNLVHKAMGIIGCKYWTSAEVAKFATDAGFIDVTVVNSKSPYGLWPKEKHLKQAGMLGLITIESGFHSYALALMTRVLGLSKEEATKICDEARDAILLRAKKDKVHSYTNL